VAAATLRERARRRLDRPEVANPEEWAKEVDAACKRGFRLVRLPGLTVSIRDYSLVPAHGPLAPED
jgi:hypothetical protein